MPSTTQLPSKYMRPSAKALPPPPPPPPEESSADWGSPPSPVCEESSVGRIVGSAFGTGSVIFSEVALSEAASLRKSLPVVSLQTVTSSRFDSLSRIKSGVFPQRLPSRMLTSPPMATPDPLLEEMSTRAAKTSP